MACTIPNSFYDLVAPSGACDQKRTDSLVRLLIGVSDDHVLTMVDYQKASLNIEHIDAPRMTRAIEEFKMAITMRIMTLGIEERNKKHTDPVNIGDLVSESEFVKCAMFYAGMASDKPAIYQSKIDALIIELAGLSNVHDLASINIDDLLKKMRDLEQTKMISHSTAYTLRKRINDIEEAANWSTSQSSSSQSSSSQSSSSQSSSSQSSTRNRNKNTGKIKSAGALKRKREIEIECLDIEIKEKYERQNEIYDLDIKIKENKEELENLTHMRSVAVSRCKNADLDMAKQLVTIASECRTEKDLAVFVSIVNHCIAMGINILSEWDQRNILTAAASNGNHLAVDYLVRVRGVDPDLDSNEYTPLMCIASGLGRNGRWNGRYAKCVDILLEHGAKINKEGFLGATALSQAVMWGCMDYAIVLLNKGANIGSKRICGDTVLHDICRHSSPKPKGQNMSEFLESVAIFLEKGANPNDQDNKGNTPFMLACQNPNPSLKLVRMLLEKVYVDTNDPSVKAAIALNISCLRTLVNMLSILDTNRKLTESDFEEYPKLKAYLEPLDMTKWVAPGCNCYDHDHD